MICKCYRAERNFFGEIGTCWGTSERDACSCGGDRSKCDFYPNIREEEKKPVTNYDHLIRKTPEELAEWLSRPPGTWVYKSKTEWLDWLKRECEV